MKKLTFAIVILALMLTITPALAEAPNVPVGASIDLTDPPKTFPAGAPFHILHGFGWSAGENKYYEIPYRGGFRGTAAFTLEVDGVPQKGFLLAYITKEGPYIIEWQRTLYNFPEGMTGTHTITGHWIYPCLGIVADLPGCTDEIFLATATINFK